MDHQEKTWYTVRSEQGPDYGIFTVRVDYAVSPRTGKEGRYVVLDSKDFVNVVAVTVDERVVLVRQHRHGSGVIDLEIPSGLVDDGEEPLAAAQRELAEETGYTGGAWTELGRIRPNAAFMNNWCYHFLARGVHRTQEPQLDSGEAIEVELHPYTELAELVRGGAMTQALVVSALYALEHRAAQY